MKVTKAQLRFSFLEFGISLYQAIPVRTEADERSEMVTQVLFGETFKILKETKKWCFIEIDFDNYQGWVDKKMVCGLNKKSYNKILSKNKSVLTSLFQEAHCKKLNKTIKLIGGSTLPEYNGKRTFKVNNNRYVLKGSVNLLSTNIRKNIIELSAMYLDAPYLWGGKNPVGIDCSGFTQIIYKMVGISIPRDASLQVEKGIAVNFLNDSNPGDLAFFDNDEGRIIHVGILIGGNQIIHASGSVRIDKIDHSGIFNEDIQRYTHQLRVIKNVID